MSDKRDIAQTIQTIVQRIVARYAPERIILFGSYAHGEPDKESDLDLLVVMDTDLPHLERYRDLRRTVGPVNIPADLFAMTPEEFEETKDVIGGLAYVPAKYGRVVYEKS